MRAVARWYWNRPMWWHVLYSWVLGPVTLWLLFR